MTVRGPDLSEFADEQTELRERRSFMIRQGFRFCDIAACNCNSWHGGHASARLQEISDLFDTYCIDHNGHTILETIEELALQAGFSKGRQPGTQLWE